MDYNLHFDWSNKDFHSGFASGYALNAGIQDVGGSSPSTATVLLPPPYSEVVF
jgi:hypothetical protein